MFVEDEPLTRGAFIFTLYEYDKKIREASQSATSENISNQLVSRHEFDSIKNKVSALEKSGLPSDSFGNKNIDIVKIISDLEPNMPMLLDSSLKSSKVFKELQQQVVAENGDHASSAKNSSSNAVALPSQKELIEMKRVLAQIQTSYVSLSKRIDELSEKSVQYASYSEKNTDIDINYFNRQLNDIKKTVAESPSANDLYKEINKSQSRVQDDIERIEKRLNGISASSRYSENSDSLSSTGNGTKIAAISLCLSMIAALFVSR